MGATTHADFLFVTTSDRASPMTLASVAKLVERSGSLDDI